MTPHALTATQFDVSRATTASRAGAAVGALLLVCLATFPFWADAGWMREFDEMACYLIFAMMWNLLAGYGGMVSIGQQAYLGLGGYGLLVMGNFMGVNPFVAVPIAAVLTMLVALPVSQIAFRLQGGAGEAGVFLTQRVVDKLPDSLPYTDSGVVETSGGFQRVWRIDPRALENVGT